MAVHWQGVFPAATTQFFSDQALDLRSTMAHLDRMIEAGIHGMIMLGTVGENCSLEYGEKLEVLKATVGHVAGRVPVLTGVAECTTALACRFALQIQADRVLGCRWGRAHWGPVRDLLSFAVFLASFWPGEVAWRGRRHRLRRDGTLA